MNEPLISIIVPVYNVEKYLEQCISSLINQTYKKLEIIVVNDGSTDRSRDIIESFQKIDSRIICINKKNGGVSSARNDGLEHIHGSYFTFVDSDDWLDLEMYEKMIYGNKLNADIVSTSVKVKKTKYIRNNILRKYFLNRDVSCCNKLFSSKLIENDDFKFDSGNVSIDVLGCYQLFKKCKLWCIVPGAYYNYRQDNLSYGRSGFSSRDLNAVEMTRKVYENVSQCCPSAKKVSEYHVIHAQYNLINKVAMFGFRTESDQSAFNSIKHAYISNIRKRILFVTFSRYFLLKEKFQIIILFFSYHLFIKLKSKRGFRPRDVKI